MSAALLYEPEEDMLVRVHRSLPVQARAVVDAIEPIGRRWLLVSLEHARLVSSLDNLTFGKTINRQQFDELPAAARELLEAAWDKAHERLFRAPPASRVHVHARAPRSAQEKR